MAKIIENESLFSRVLPIGYILDYAYFVYHFFFVPVMSIHAQKFV